MNPITQGAREDRNRTYLIVALAICLFLVGMYAYFSKDIRRGSASAPSSSQTGIIVPPPEAKTFPAATSPVLRDEAGQSAPPVKERVAALAITQPGVVQSGTPPFSQQIIVNCCPERAARKPHKAKEDQRPVVKNIQKPVTAAAKPIDYPPPDLNRGVAKPIDYPPLPMNGIAPCDDRCKGKTDVWDPRDHPRQPLPGQVSRRIY